MLAAAGYGMPRALNAQHGKGQNHAGIFRVVNLEEFSIESAELLMKKSNHPVRKKLRPFSSQLGSCISGNELSVNDVPDNRPVDRTRIASGLADRSQPPVNGISLGAVVAAVDNNIITRSWDLADTLGDWHNFNSINISFIIVLITM